MGEIAEMMLDGTLCAGCGEFLFDNDGFGFPGYCPSCAPDWLDEPQLKAKRTIKCTQCQRKFATVEAMEQHGRDKHKRPSND